MYLCVCAIAIQLHTPSIFAYSWVCVCVYENEYKDEGDDDDNDQNNGSIFSRTAVHYAEQHLQNQANKWAKKKSYNAGCWYWGRIPNGFLSFWLQPRWCFFFFFHLLVFILFLIVFFYLFSIEKRRVFVVALQNGSNKSHRCLRFSNAIWTIKWFCWQRLFHFEQTFRSIHWEQLNIPENAATFHGAYFLSISFSNSLHYFILFILT